tara:strand:+ start:8968 stop:9441 length:474 start_codon:yes stop_codon:yes gene_type:complete
MAGGLFRRPFVLNEKCVIFSLICMTLFLYKPSFKSNFALYLTLFIIFIIAYVAMAWYDFYFNCDILPLKRGTHSITGKFKPPAHQENKQVHDKDTTVDKYRRRMLIFSSHLLFIVPILAYIAIKKTKVNKIVYPLLGVMAIFTAGYHGASLIIETKL